MKPELDLESDLPVHARRRVRTGTAAWVAPRLSVGSPMRSAKSPRLVWLLLALLAGLTPRLPAQPAEVLIAQGRAFLEAQNLPAANARFATAVAANPSHAEANALYAATRLLVLLDRPPLGEFLTRAGLPATNRTIFGGQLTWPKDTNGVWLFAPGALASEAVALLRTNLLGEILAAEQNLAVITNTGFLLTLSSNETSLTNLTVDFGDVQMLRAWLRGAECAALVAGSCDLDLPLATLTAIGQGTSTLQAALAAYPLVFGPGVTNELAAAQGAFTNAVDLYLTASTFIRSRPAGEVRLFNFRAEDAPDEADFRLTLADLRYSLEQPVVRRSRPSLMLHLGALLENTDSWRTWLPAFHSNSVVAGTLPDATFGGMFPGTSRQDFENWLLGRGGFISVAGPVFTTPDRLYAVAGTAAFFPVTIVASEGGVAAPTLAGGPAWLTLTNFPTSAVSTFAGRYRGNLWAFAGDAGPATSADLNGPTSVAVEADGATLLADSGNHRIRRVLPSGALFTVAGSYHLGRYAGEGGAATQARLDYPTDVAVGPDGVIYLADSQNHRIRKVGLDGRISLLAGVGGFRWSGGDDGPAVQAGLNSPQGVVVDREGNVFLADSGNHRIRRVGTNGVISLCAGSGDAGGFSGDGGPAAEARFNWPTRLAVDTTGNLFIADTANHRVRRIGADGIVTTVAGGDYGYSGDGGSATNARLRAPQGLALDAAGNLYVADTGNHCIRRVTPDGRISTIAGLGERGWSGDGGPGLVARLDHPMGLAVTLDGRLLVADWRNTVIRQFSLTPSLWLAAFPGLVDPGIYSLSVQAAANGIHLVQTVALRVGTGGLEILEHPRSLAVPAAGTAVFHVVAVGAPPLSYRWHKDGEPLADDAHFQGTATDTLLVLDVQADHPGAYHAKITHPDGVTNSQPAGLTLFGPDLWPPRLTITSHYDFQDVGTNRVLLAGTATDALTGSNGVVSVSINGARAANDTAAAGDTAFWSRSLTLVPGVNTFNIVPTDGVGNSAVLPLHLVWTPPPTNATRAWFAGADAASGGSWKGRYGSAGFRMVSNSEWLPTRLGIVPQGAAEFLWGFSYTNLAFLEVTTPTTPARRVGSCWYAADSFSLMITSAIPQMRRVALYFQDLGAAGRLQFVEVLDAGSGRLLDSRVVSSFADGVYLRWAVQGPVRFRLTRWSTGNVILNGVFLDPVEVGAAPTAWDGGTQGHWPSRYGTEGFWLAGDASQTGPYPGDITFTGATLTNWAANPSQPEALLRAGAGSNRVAAAWTGETNFTCTLSGLPGVPRRIGLYCLDWQGDGTRAQQIDVFERDSERLLDTQVLSNFTAGAYLVWDVAGPLRFRVSGLDGAPVVSGIFLDPPMPLVTPAAGDEATQGNWRDLYGLDGWAIPGAGTNPPAYGALNVISAQPLLWSATTSDPRALQRPAPAAPGARLASAWTGSGAMVFEMRQQGRAMRRLGLYFLDWDNAGRVQRVELLDPAGDTVLHSQVVSNFAGGVYRVWEIAGSVRVRVAPLTGTPVLSGMFFDPMPAASFAGGDAVTRGDWRPKFGVGGHALPGLEPALPAPLTLTNVTAAVTNWSDAPTAPGALQDPRSTNDAERVGAAWAGADFLLTLLGAPPSEATRLRAYFLDWDHTQRTQRVDVFDGVTGRWLDTQIISGFTNGLYLGWRLGGPVRLRAGTLNGGEAVLSGLFLDPPAAQAVFAGGDFTSQGAWKGFYGTQGLAIAGDVTNPPASTHLSFGGASEFVWLPATTSPRALQRADSTNANERVAATWFSPGPLDVRVKTTGPAAQRVSLYELDWDRGDRLATVTALDTVTGRVLDERRLAYFGAGRYLAWDTFGAVTFRVTPQRHNAVVSGLFFNAASDALPLVPPADDVDSDNDGLSDAVELLLGLNPLLAGDASADFDGDGQSNLQEYLQGTDLFDPASRLSFRVSVAGGTVHLEFSTVATRSYQVEWTDSLDAGSWSPLAPPVAGTGELRQLTDPTPVQQSRFYRLAISRPS